MKYGRLSITSETWSPIPYPLKPTKPKKGEELLQPVSNQKGLSREERQEKHIEWVKQYIISHTAKWAVKKSKNLL